MLKNLTLPQSGYITHIIHISDIHIRVGDPEKSRYDDYARTFDNLEHIISSLSSVKQRSAVTLFCGDFFHFKNRLDSLSVKLFNLFIDKITKYTPLYIIQGNHDFLQSSGNIPDVISSLLYANKNIMVNYLDTSGHYVANNVGFGTVCIKDTLKIGDGSGYIDNMPQFPQASIFPSHVKSKVALFHGSFKDAVFFNGLQSPNGLSIDWVKSAGYDIGLFGDIHKTQIHPNNTNKWGENEFKWAYAGSLLQLDFGESIYNHGFLLWDLESHTVEHHEVTSPSLFINISCEKDTIICHLDKNSVITLDEFIHSKGQSDSKIDHMFIKIKGDVPLSQIDSIQNTLKKHNITHKITKGLLTNTEDSHDLLNCSDMLTDITQYNSQEKWIQYIQDTDTNNILDNQPWREWIFNPQTILLSYDNTSNTINDTISKRNKNISVLINDFECKLIQVKDSKKQPFRIKYMTWDYILCFGKGNFFNFDDASNKICVINGQNSSGKSSFLEAIIIGLFGEDFPSRQDKSHSASIICHKKPTGVNAQVTIIFTVGTKYYKISRVFEKHSDIRYVDKIHTKKLSLVEVDQQDHVIRQISTSNKSTNDWINENIGQFKNLLMSCIISQSSDSDFFSLKDMEQIQLLDEVLHIDCIDNISAVLKETSLELDAIQKQCTTLRTHIINDDQNTPIIDADAIENKNLFIDNKTKELELLKSQTILIKETWHHLKQNDLILDEMTISKNIDKFKKLISTITEKVDSYNELSQQKAVLDSKIKEIGQIHIPLTYKLEYEAQLVILENSTPIKPQCTLDYYQKQVETIENWRQKNKNVLTNPEHTILTEIETLNSNIENLKVLIQDSIKNKPNKPDISMIQYNKFQQDLKKSQLAITTLPIPYNDITELEKFCVNNELQKINGDVSCDQLQRQIDNETAQLIDHKWSTCNINMLNQHLKEKDKLLVDINNQLIKSYELLNNYEKNKINLSKETDIHTDEINNIGDLVKPNKSITEIEKWILNFDKMTLQLQQNDHELSLLINGHKKWTESNEQLSALNRQLEQVTQELIEIENQSFPFNPKCDACKQQPWKVRQLQLVSKKDLLIRAINTITLPQIDPIITAKKITELSNWIDNYKQLQKSLENHKNYKQQWIDFENKSKILSSLRNERKNKYLIITEINQNIKAITNELKNIENEKCNVTSHITGLHYAINNRQKWINMSQQIIDIKKYQHDFQLHQVYAQYKKLNIEYYQKQKQLIDLTNKWNDENNFMTNDLQYKSTSIDSLKNKLSIIQQNETYTTNEKEYRNNIASWNLYNQYKDNIKKLKHCIYQHQSNILGEKINKIKMLVDYQKQYDYWVDISTNKPLYIKKLLINEEIDELQKLIQELCVDVAQCKMINDRHVKNIKEMEAYENIIEKTENKQKAVDFMHKALANYRSWLYTNTVIPNIVKEVNRIVTSVTHCTEFSLDASVSTDKHNKININWSINSPSGSSIIKKSGGFRRYIYGLIMRITLSHMGASHINNSQLFIDEGFTACDADNLEKMPDFLKNLLELFNSGIIIVSHLQTIKDCGDISVNITRAKDSTSLIQFDNNSSYIRSNSEIPLRLKVSLKSNIKPKITTVKKIIETENVCIAIKKNGEKCKYKAKKGSYCSIHTPKINT